MELTREEALKLHRDMWSDMQKALGNRPLHLERHHFKTDWVEKMFPGEQVLFNCFLCEYVANRKGGVCGECPINWGGDFDLINTCQKRRVCGGIDWRYSPISEILALPENEV